MTREELKSRAEAAGWMLCQRLGKEVWYDPEGGHITWEELEGFLAEQEAKKERQKTCDHDWKFVNDSFDHEFGCEQIHFYRCEKCDATRECDSRDDDAEAP